MKVLNIGKYIVQDFKSYKYKVIKDYIVDLGISYVTCTNKYFALANGILKIYYDYRWDGASGPAIDTKNFALPSLVHDCLYQICREGNLSNSECKRFRKDADKILLELCKQQGMGIIRRNYVYLGVRIFGGLWNKK